MAETSEEELRNELNGIYTPLEEAKEEIWRRWNDKELREKVERYLNLDIPEPMKNSPRAALSRHVSSPNFELLKFVDSAKKICLEPLFLEYTKDKFVSKNLDKYYLGRMTFVDGVGKKGGLRLSSIKIIDFDKYDGERFLNLKTLWDSSFVDFHHSLLEPLVSGENIVDMSSAYLRNGTVAREYYGYILSLFVCHGILFENFILSESYADLTVNIFLPTFNKIQERFGVKPLIVQLIPAERENSEYWRFYPKDVQDKVMRYNG